jgi:hypothetical protein
MSESRPTKHDSKEFAPGTAGGPSRKPATKKFTLAELRDIIYDASNLELDAMLATHRSKIPEGLPPELEEQLKQKQRMADAAQRILLKRLAAELGE